MAAAIIVARTAGIDGFAMFTLMVTAEMIGISALNALFAAPPSVLAPGRQTRVRNLIFGTAERYQTRAGAGLGVLGISIPLALGAPLVLSIAFGGYLAAAAIVQARRATYIASFRSRPVAAAETLIAATAVACPLFAGGLDVDVVTLFWASQAITHTAALIVLRATSITSFSPYLHRVARSAIISTGVRMLSGSLALSASGRSQAFLIGTLLGGPAVAVFGAANTAAAPIRLVAGSLRGALLPRLALRHRGVGPESSRYSRLAVAATTSVLATGLVLGSAVAAPTLTLVLGEDFQTAERLVPFAVALALAGFASSVAATVRQSRGESGFCGLVRWVSAATVIPSATLGASLGGLPGILLACAATEIATCVALAIGPIFARESRCEAVSTLQRWWSTASIA